MSDTNKQILEKGNAAIMHGNYEGFLEHCTEDTVWNFLGDRVLNGKEEVRQWMAEVYDEPPVFEVTQMLSDADHVVAMGTIRLKDNQGIPVENSYCDVWRFRDGKMCELHAYVIPSGK